MGFTGSTIIAVGGTFLTIALGGPPVGAIYITTVAPGLIATGTVGGDIATGPV